VGSRYLDHLLLERQYAQAAALCPKLLRGSAPAWERYSIWITPEVDSCFSTAASQVHAMLEASCMLLGECLLPNCKLLQTFGLWHADCPICGMQWQHPILGHKPGRQKKFTMYNKQPCCCALEDRWVFHFAHLRQLPSLAPHIPTSNPQLRDTVYEVCVACLLL
jgi:hypothetical protein